MSDWIPVPEIDNVLVVIAQMAENPEDIMQAPVMPLLNSLKEWHGGSVYVFHDPPEAGEVLEDVDPEMAARFALAAQMTDARGEVCRDAFRRVFSRATVKKVVLIAADNGSIKVEDIQTLFDGLDDSDFVWAGEWPGRFGAGMRSFYTEIFSGAEDANFDLRKAIEAKSSGDGLKLEVVEWPQGY